MSFADAGGGGALPSLLPTDPLEVYGMKAGVSDHDHGPFRAASWASPADLTDSEFLTIPPGEIPPDEARLCSAPWPTVESDVIVATVTTASGDPVDLRADVMVPAGSDGPAEQAIDGASLPVIVFVPGGGFVLSPKSGALLRRTAIAQRGFVVVSVEYRTLRHGTYRDGIADVAAAVDWVREHAPRFGGDSERIALWGESAGGYLSSMAVTTGAVSGVRCVASVFGLTDLSQVAMDFDADEQARHHTPEITEAQYVFGRRSGTTILEDPGAVQAANPVRHVSGDEPPFLLLHGSVDGLVSSGQSQLLHRALLSAGVESTRLVVEGAGHYGIEWCTATVLDRIAEFLSRHLS